MVIVGLGAQGHMYGAGARHTAGRCSRGKNNCAVENRVQLTYGIVIGARKAGSTLCGRVPNAEKLGSRL